MPSSDQHFDRSIVDGPLPAAVWKLAWPTMLQNMVMGLQGLVDHALVGHFVGYTANAAIGVSWQIFLLVIVFTSSLYIGMSVLVSRYVGAGDAGSVNRVVSQAFLVSFGLSLFVLAPAGYLLAPSLLDLVNAAPDVKAEALPFLRIMFVFSLGMLVFFLLGGAFRAAGDARTPLHLGIALTVLNVAFNVVFIRGLGPIPGLGTKGAAIGTVTANALVAMAGAWLLFGNRSVIRLSTRMNWRPDPAIIRPLFRFGLPAGFQGVAMNVAGVLLLRYIGSLDHSAAAQAAYAVGYTELFSFITWTSIGLMGATATVAGQNLGAGRPDRSARGAFVAARFGLVLAVTIGVVFLAIPRQLYAGFGLTEPHVVGIGVELLRYLSISGLFITVALAYTGGLQGSGDTRSPFFISVISQIVVPIGTCAIASALWHLEPHHVWRAIVLGHITRSVLTVLRFRQGRWRQIRV